MCNASCFLTPVLQGKHKQMKECLHPALPGTHGLVSLPTGLFQSRFPSALIQTVVHKHRQLHATFRSQRQGSRFSGEGQGVIRGEQQKVPTAALWLCLGGSSPALWLPGPGVRQWAGPRLQRTAREQLRFGTTGCLSPLTAYSSSLALGNKLARGGRVSHMAKGDMWTDSSLCPLLHH